METLTIKHENGSTVYILLTQPNKLPVAYCEGTDLSVIGILEQCRKDDVRLIIDYGDIKTGKSWNEIHDISGYIGLSRGKDAFFPILVYNKRSLGGIELLTNCIVKILTSKGKKILYQHPQYSC